MNQRVQVTHEEWRVIQVISLYVGDVCVSEDSEWQAIFDEIRIRTLWQRE